MYYQLVPVNEFGRIASIETTHYFLVLLQILMMYSHLLLVGRTNNLLYWFVWWTKNIKIVVMPIPSHHQMILSNVYNTYHSTAIFST